LDRYRIREGFYATSPGDPFEAFRIRGPHGRELTVIASDGDKDAGIEWEHVSVSCSTRCPNWIEMDFVKGLFWDDEETVMQLHPPRSKWINNHSYCLHLWKPWNIEIPLPPDITVGIKTHP
jgi:hypothetical protein